MIFGLHLSLLGFRYIFVPEHLTPKMYAMVLVVLLPVVLVVVWMVFMVSLLLWLGHRGKYTEVLTG